MRNIADMTPNDPRLESVARTICSLLAGDPDTDWPQHVDAARGWLRNVDRSTPANDPAPRRISFVGELRGDEFFSY